MLSGSMFQNKRLPPEPKASPPERRQPAPPPKSADPEPPQSARAPALPSYRFDEDRPPSLKDFDLSGIRELTGGDGSAPIKGPIQRSKTKGMFFEMDATGTPTRWVTVPIQGWNQGYFSINSGTTQVLPRLGDDAATTLEAFIRGVEGLSPDQPIPQIGWNSVLAHLAERAVDPSYGGMPTSLEIPDANELEVEVTHYDAWRLTRLPYLTARRSVVTTRRDDSAREDDTGELTRTQSEGARYRQAHTSETSDRFGGSGGGSFLGFNLSANAESTQTNRDETDAERTGNVEDRRRTERMDETSRTRGVDDTEESEARTAYADWELVRISSFAVQGLKPSTKVLQEIRSDGQGRMIAPRPVWLKSLDHAEQVLEKRGDSCRKEDLPSSRSQ